jgi:hypothetical protein
MKFSRSQKNKHKKYPSQKGFALLLAVLVAGVLLSITYLMFSINLKQITLSTTGANSQYALFAADTGIECALRQDNKVENAFILADSTTDLSDNTTQTISAPNPIPDLTCNNKSVGPKLISEESQPNQIHVDNIAYNKGLKYTFTVDSLSGGVKQGCAIVTVSKYIDTKTEAGHTTEYVRTKIESRGYNTCLNKIDPQRVERDLEVYY